MKVYIVGKHTNKMIHNFEIWMFAIYKCPHFLNSNLLLRFSYFLCVIVYKVVLEDKIICHEYKYRALSLSKLYVILFEHLKRSKIIVWETPVGGDEIEHVVIIWNCKLYFFAYVSCS